MSSYSLSKTNIGSIVKVKAAIIVTILTVTLAEAAVLLHFPEIIDEALIGVALLSTLVGFYYLIRVDREFARTIEVCDRINQGDFEARILRIKEGGQLGPAVPDCGFLAEGVVADHEGHDPRAPLAVDGYHLGGLDAR